MLFSLPLIASLFHIAYPISTTSHFNPHISLFFSKYVNPFAYLLYALYRAIGSWADLRPHYSKANIAVVLNLMVIGEFLYAVFKTCLFWIKMV